MADQEITTALKEESMAPSPRLLEKQDKNQKIIDDYYAFFTGKKVDMLPYVYKESSEAYSALIHSPEYYLFRDEVNVIDHNKDALKEHLAGVTDIIEIGPGCDYTVEKKTVPILNCAPDLKRYHAIDYSENYLHEACNSVLSRRSDIEVCGIKADLMNGRINIGDVPGGKKCVLFLGSTLGNFTDEQQVYAVNQIANMTNTGDTLILGVDTNSDVSSILGAYNNKHLSRLMVSALYYFTNINPEFTRYVDHFAVCLEWNEHHRSARIDFIAEENVFVNLLPYHETNIIKGEVLQAAIAKKFTLSEISNLFKNKFDISRTLDYSGKMKIVICKRA